MKQKRNDRNMFNNFDLFLRRFTTYAFILGAIVFFYSNKLPYHFNEAVRGIVLTTALGVLIMYYKIGSENINLFYKDFFPSWFPESLYSYWDFIAHFALPLLIGIPTSLFGYSSGVIIIFLWYLFIRKDINELYGYHIDKNTYDMAIVKIPFVIIFIIIIQNLI